jgi:hypothetical protein
VVTPPSFDLLACRFDFEAVDRVSFPPGSAGNAFRGAFGHIFRRIAPGTEFATVFEPECANGPSGLADAPRPFVIRAAAAEARAYAPGETFFIDVHVFDLRRPLAAWLASAFAALERVGIGPARARARLREFRTQPISVLLQAGAENGAPRGRAVLTLRFLTPTELKSEGRILADAPFAALFARARDRVSTLSALYGPGPLDIDFRGMAARAAAVEVVSSCLEWIRTERRSSRTGQVHPLGGFTGEVRYAGNLREFLPILRAASWTGIGRQTVWGKGAFALLLE